MMKRSGVDEERSGVTVGQVAKGAILGRYVVLGLVGGGAMGEVYAAFDPELNRKVAIKLVKTREAHPTAAARGRERLLREAQAIARLSHPNVVVVHDVGTFGESVFIAMEFVEGQTLADWLRATERGWREVLGVFIAAGRGLVAAHAGGLIHRDFKPENVMITDSGQVRVMDFGLVCELGTGADLTATLKVEGCGGSEGPSQTAEGVPGRKLTRTGAMLGTPAYMAPEQFAGEITDARTDQFSFSIALWEALYRERPFRGDTIVQLMEAVTSGAVRDPPANTRVPGWIRRVLLRGLRVDRRDRYPSIDALLLDLGRDPAVRRRRLITVVTGVLLLAATGAGARRLSADRRALCAAGPGRAATAWGPERRREVERAFTASGNSNAAHAFAATAELIDEYVGRWTALYSETCKATHVRGDQSEEVLDLRMECLSDRLTSVRVLSDVLSQADVSVVDNAVVAASGLPTLERCSDIPMLRAVVRPPDDLATRARVEALREDVARVRALADAGQCERASTAGERLIEATAAIAYEPLRAEALLAVGLLGEFCSDPGKAAQRAEEASYAAEMSRDDQTVIQAAVLLSVLYADRMNDVPTARRWVRHGEAVLARFPQHPELEALVMVARSVVSFGAGQTAAAVDEGRRALVLQEKVHGPVHLFVAVGLANLGLYLMENGQVIEAEAPAARSLELMRKLFGETGAGVALARVNYGEILTGLRRFEEAGENIDQALAIWEKQHASQLFVGTALLARGRLELATGDRVRAKATLLDAAPRLGKESPRFSAEVDFALAQVKWGEPAGRAEALRLARRAREMMAGAMGSPRKIGEIDTWLATRGRL